MSLQLPSRTEFQSREYPEMQGQRERPFKYLVLKGLNVPNSIHILGSGSCSSPTSYENKSPDLQVQIEDFR